MDNPWKFEKEQNGIKIYTRAIEGWAIKEYKAVFYVKTALIAVENALRDTPNQTKWSKNTLLAEEIKKISRNNFYTYSQSDSPWPATDRDNVVHIEYSYPSPKMVRIDINSEPNFIPQKAGYVRVTQMKGHWHLKEIEDGLTEVTQQAVVNPGGAAPNWLINAFLIDGPLETFKNFKDYVERNVAALTKN